MYKIPLYLTDRLEVINICVTSFFFSSFFFLPNWVVKDGSSYLKNYLLENHFLLFIFKGEVL